MTHRNGQIDLDSYEVEEFLLRLRREAPISKLSDLYSIGAIMYKMLFGRAPTPLVSRHIAENDLHK